MGYEVGFCVIFFWFMAVIESFELATCAWEMERGLGRRFQHIWKAEKDSQGLKMGGRVVLSCLSSVNY